jgi:hypothetical protein
MPSAVPVVRTADQARALARRLYPGSTPFQGAFVDGWRAGRALRGVEACPYMGGKRSRARQGWRPVWRAIWLRGYGHGFRSRGTR